MVNSTNGASSAYAGGILTDTVVQQDQCDPSFEDSRIADAYGSLIEVCQNFPASCRDFQLDCLHF